MAGISFFAFSLSFYIYIYIYIYITYLFYHTAYENAPPAGSKSYRALFMGQIEQNCVLILNWIVWNKTACVC